jgi:photosystem II stability/assembly factor-like uncharacterized protein
MPHCRSTTASPSRTDGRAVVAARAALTIRTMLKAQMGLAAALIGVAVTLFVAPQWTPQPSPITARLRGVSAVSAIVAWASGSQGTVLRTSDGGQTWNPLAVNGASGLDFRDVDAINERTAYILSIGNGPQSRIYKTTDAGATWTLQFTNDDPKGFYDAMSFWDEAHGLVFGDSIDGRFAILVTENGGATWTRVPRSVLPPALPNEGAFAASGSNIAVVGSGEAWIATGAAIKSRVLHTRDRGRSWSISDTPIASGRSSGIFSITFRDTRHGVIVGGDYSKESEAIDNAATTSDGGRNWDLVKEHGLSGFRSAVKYVPRTKSTLVAVGPQGADLSTDDGRSWTPLPGTTSMPGFDALSFVPGQPIAWASGAKGALARLAGF